jgi:hypothetical protein
MRLVDRGPTLKNRGWGTRTHARRCDRREVPPLREPTRSRSANVKKRRRLASVGMTGCAWFLAAVDGGVADVLALDDVDDVFGDVGGVVADAFEVFGD